MADSSDNTLGPGQGQPMDYRPAMENPGQWHYIVIEPDSKAVKLRPMFTRRALSLKRIMLPVQTLPGSNATQNEVSDGQERNIPGKQDIRWKQAQAAMGQLRPVLPYPDV